jgi:hypothetical protein
MARPADNAGPPLYISSLTRKGGVVSIEILNHALTAADVGRQITVVMPSRPDVNVTSTISQVVLPHTVRFRQSVSLPDIDIGISGGAAAINT